MWTSGPLKSIHTNSKSPQTPYILIVNPLIFEMPTKLPAGLTQPWKTTSHQHDIYQLCNWLNLNHQSDCSYFKPNSGNNFAYGLLADVTTPNRLIHESTAHTPLWVWSRQVATLWAGWMAQMNQGDGCQKILWGNPSSKGSHSWVIIIDHHHHHQHHHYRLEFAMYPIDIYFMSSLSYLNTPKKHEQTHQFLGCLGDCKPFGLPQIFRVMSDGNMPTKTWGAMGLEPENIFDHILTNYSNNLNKVHRVISANLR